MPTASLYLVTPEIEDAGAFAALLREALGAAQIAAVLLRFADKDERSRINAAKALVPLIQGSGAAALIEGEASTAARAGADGVHVTGGPEALREAVESLKPQGIVGAGAVRSKHDAMTAGEADIDYVMFGEAKRDMKTGELAFPPLHLTIERAAWWAEVFEIPCVALASSADAIAPLAATGAEFIALGPWLFEDQHAIAGHIRDASTQIAQAVAAQAATGRA